MIAVAVPVGIAIGLIMGALGGGGSILTVPALVYLLHQSPPAATTASLVIVTATAFSGMWAHLRHGRVRVAHGMTFGTLGIAGSYVGSLLSVHVDPQLLLALFSALMLVAAGFMLRRRRPRPARADGPAHEGLPASTARRWARVAAAATGVGLVTGFFGVGGGFVIVPALVLVLGFEMPAAVGTSLLVIGINGAAALAARLGHGVDVSWGMVAAFSVAAMVGALGGNQVASRVDAAKLSVGFALLLVLVAVYTASRSVPHLL